MSGPFKLKSGNKSPLEFKMMGSSPVKQDEKKVQTKFDVGDREVEFTGEGGKSIPPAGSMISGDIQKIYTDRSKEGLTSSDTLYYNIHSGETDYYDPEGKQSQQNMPGFEKGKPYLGTKK